MEKSRLRNRHLKYPSRENLLAYKNIKNKCNNLLKKSKKKYIKDISNKGAAASKSFWNPIKPFITHKGIQTNEKITIEVEKNEQIKVKDLHEKVDIRMKDLVKDDKILVEMFNKHYINIVEETSRVAPKNLGNPLDPKLDEKIFVELLKTIKITPNIIKIKEIVKEKLIFIFPEATAEDIYKVIKSLNPNKATGPDYIPLKTIKNLLQMLLILT